MFAVADVSAFVFLQSGWLNVTANEWLLGAVLSSVAGVIVSIALILLIGRAKEHDGQTAKITPDSAVGGQSRDVDHMSAGTPHSPVGSAGKAIGSFRALDIAIDSKQKASTQLQRGGSSLAHAVANPS